MTELGADSSAEEVLAYLQSLKDEANLEGMARYGIVTETALGIPNAVLRPLARQIKRNHNRALLLWASGIREARLLAAFTDEPKKVTLDQARAWTSEFDSWEIVDGVSDLYVDAELYPVLIPEFAADNREFVRRTAFAMMCWCAVHLKKEPDEAILAFLPLIKRHAVDPRNFVKKAVNWALRSVGKRNLACHGPALALAETLAASTDKTERWIGKDAVRELRSEKIISRLTG
jgi:3-methyladenine DNA glycosylase AlkD